MISGAILEPSLVRSTVSGKNNVLHIMPLHDLKRPNHTAAGIFVLFQDSHIVYAEKAALTVPRHQHSPLWGQRWAFVRDVGALEHRLGQKGRFSDEANCIIARQIVSDRSGLFVNDLSV